jgi:hypothetical protein
MMDHNFGGLSEEQQNDCRAALQKFVDRHAISDWGMTVTVQQTTAGKYSVKIEITPSPESGFPAWPVQEIAVADSSVDVAAEVDRMLELAYQDQLSARKTQQQ